VIGAAVLVGKIATGEVEDTKLSAEAINRGKAGGKKGGKARSAKLTAQQREEIARIAASARWKKSR
jgi:hypothetical protein